MKNASAETKELAVSISSLNSDRSRNCRTSLEQQNPGDLLSDSSSIGGNAENGGEISLSTTAGNITTGDLFSSSDSSSSNGNAKNGGEITLSTTAGNITTGDIFSFSVSTSGNVGNGGDIALDAQDGDIIGTDSRTFSSVSISGAETGKAGTGGNITLKAKNNITDIEIFTLSSDSKSGTVQVEGFGDLSLTNIKLITSKQVTIENPITREEINIDVSGRGQSGDVFINGLGNLTFNNSRIESDTKGSDSAGNVTITSPGMIIFENNSNIKTNTSSTGEAGIINISAGEGINITGANSGLFAQTSNQGKAGNIIIKSPLLTLQYNAQISTSTTNIGNAGEVNLNANKFKITNGATVQTNTFSSGEAGNITLNILDKDSESFILLEGNNSGIFASTEPGSTGNGGSIFIDPVTMIIRDGAGIAASSQGSGEGGNIDIEIGTLTLDNTAFISTETATNQGGNINLNIQDKLFLRNNSQISATAGTASAGGDGGNITINAPFILAIPSENSDITANAFTGNGGRISLTAQGILGIEPRLRLTSFSDITASSRFGLVGIVEINTPDISPNQGLTQLPQIDKQVELAKGCEADDGEETVAFFNIGRGGLPPTPQEPLGSETIIAPWIPLLSELEQTSQEEDTTEVGREIKPLSPPCREN
ncbi:MAG: S-layer family protein [Moorea sp. SIO2B7]|nr:S-layer family protein [Moorena sp. SIO2B7]